MEITDINVARNLVMDEILKGTEYLKVTVSFYVTLEGHKYSLKTHSLNKVSIGDDYFHIIIPTQNYITDPIKIWEALNTYGIENEIRDGIEKEKQR